MKINLSFTSNGPRNTFKTSRAREKYSNCRNVKPGTGGIDKRCKFSSQDASTVSAKVRSARVTRRSYYKMCSSIMR